MKITISCPLCKQKMRIPVMAKKIKVTCPNCYNAFIYQIQLPNALLKIINFFSNIFHIEERKFSHTTVGYTDITASGKLKKIFILWLLIILFLFGISYFLKKHNDTNYLKKIYFMQDKGNSNYEREQNGKSGFGI